MFIRILSHQVNKFCQVLSHRHGTVFLCISLTYKRIFYLICLLICLLTNDLLQVFRPFGLLHCLYSIYSLSLTANEQ